MAALVSICLACIHPVLAWRAWSGTELAMRLRAPLPSPGLRPGGVAFALGTVPTVVCGLLGGVAVVAIRLGTLALG